METDQGQATATTSGFLNAGDYRATAYIHFFVDVLNSSRALLVALLAASLGLSNTQIGIALLLYTVGNAASQPLFGTLADKYGPRQFLLGGLAWMIVFYGLAAVSSDWIALISVTVAGLGSGAFHPSGTMLASRASHHNQTQATSFFFMAGQIGLFVGPIATGILLEAFGRSAYLALPLLAISALIAGYRTIERGNHFYHDSHLDEGETAPFRLAKGSRNQAVLLAVIIFCTGTVTIATINFAPVYFTEIGLSVSRVGWLSGMLLLGGAIGGVVGATLADRFGGRRVIALSMLLAIVPLYTYTLVSGMSQIVLMILAGFFMGMPHSILVLRGQGLLPGRRATASGLVLGYMFFVGSLGGAFLGILADKVGLQTALQALAILPIIAAATSFFLKPRRN